MAARGDTPCRTRRIYEEYTDLCQFAGVDPLAQRSVHNHLSDLRMLGILTAEENRSGSRGNYYSYALDVPFSSALSALSDVLSLEEMLTKLETCAQQNDVA